MGITPATRDALDTIKNLETRYFREFMQAKNKYEYIVLIEGDDQPYYMPLCASHLRTQDIHYIRCEGKGKVLETISTIDNHTNESYVNSKCFGIVDKDYGLDNINSDRVYVTPVYSYENFYVSKVFFRNVLSSYFQIKDCGIFSGDYERAFNNFENRLLDYIEIIKDIDKKYRATQISQKLLKDDIPPFTSSKINLSQNIIKISLDRVELINAEEILKENISDSYTEESLAVAEEQYKHSDLWKYAKDIRGKFLARFIVDYFKCLVHSATESLEDTTIFTKRRELLKKQRENGRNNRQSSNDVTVNKINLQFNDKNFFSTLASSAEQPECFGFFLKEFSIKYN